MFDPILHQPVRSKLISMLIVNEELSFKHLRDTFVLTDGNLSSHLSKLEAEGYIFIDKQFQDKKPKTSIKITEDGRRAFEKYIEALKKFIEETE